MKSLKQERQNSMKKPNMAKEYKRILKQEQAIRKLQTKERVKRMEKEQAYTYLEFLTEKEFEKVYKVFNWKDKHTKDYIHIDSVRLRLYIWNIEDTPSVIKQLLAFDDTMEIQVFINHKWGEPFNEKTDI